MVNTLGEKELKTKWPHATGITAEAKHDGRQINLVPTEASNVLKMHRRG